MDTATHLRKQVIPWVETQGNVSVPNKTTRTHAAE